MRAKIRAELAKIKPGATQCPGKLSRNLGRTLRELRPTLEAMARAGQIKFYQKGRRVQPGEFRGPFRVTAE
jgi:predicted transcriptional regulator